MTESIKIENPQQPLVPLERSETISWIGYVQRPINQRKQVRNTYLDNINIGILSSVWFIPTFTLENWNIIKSWTLNRVLDWDKIYVPETWTYIINASTTIVVGSPATTSELRLSYDGIIKLVIWVLSTSPYGMWSATTVLNIKKWDYLLIKAGTNSSWWQIRLDISVTKIS